MDQQGWIGPHLQVPPIKTDGQAIPHRDIHMLVELSLPRI